MRVLLVTMYFPPAGGGGVPRPLKIAQHLAELGIETHVLAPTDPKRLHRDESLSDPPGAIVHRLANVGPGVRRPSEELRSAHGLDRIGIALSLTFRRLLVPDPGIVWSLCAILPAARIVRRHAIDVVITSSPPGSTNLVGAAAKRLTGVEWVTDLRDSLTKPLYRRREMRGEHALARLVARQASATVAVSEPIAEQMRALNPAGPVEVIDHGSDFDDFEGLEHHPSDRMRITHTGTMFGGRDPRPFLEALSRSGPDVVARFAGDFRAADRAYATTLGLDDRVEVLPYMPRRETLALQRDSEVLLILVQESTGRGRSIITTKVFEYIAAGRPILAAVPAESAVADLVRDLDLGLVVRPDDPDSIAAGIEELESRWREGVLLDTALAPDRKAGLSRRARVEQLTELLRGIVDARGSVGIRERT
ncbi:MAG TPA: glycosyltransferase family 4 protein [Gaiellaceae bacterium]|nr:glycosyltransferase family 4 protein [Gaiellaceae bacterium]